MTDGRDSQIPFRAEIEVAGHKVVLEIVPSRAMPEKYDELRVWLPRSPLAPAWTTDLEKG